MSVWGVQVIVHALASMAIGMSEKVGSVYLSMTVVANGNAKASVKDSRNA
jgi:hypothetical protein